MISIIGATGYVGGYFKKRLIDRDIPFVTFSARFPLDEREFEKHLLQNKVTKVINCAGFTGKPNVDSCEREENKTECLFANALLPKAIADVCNKHNIDMYHVSSGCIYFDVECEKAHKPSRMFTEEDMPNFTFQSGYSSWYSGTKALGEELLYSLPVHIFRLRIPFDGSLNDRNYIQKIIKYPKLLAATNSFSHLNEFVDNIITCATLYTSYTPSYSLQKSQIFNLTQPGYLNTFEVVEMLRQRDLVTNKSWFADVEDFAQNTLAPRSNCVLDSTKALKRKFKLTHIQDAMELAIDQYAFNLNNYAQTY